MPLFEVKFQSVIEVTRTYEADDKHEAQKLGQMDAEDGQIGSFYDRNPVDGDVLEVKEV